MAYNSTSIELEYIIVGAKFNVDFLDSSFTKDEKKELREFIDAMSQEICIDKSYVDCHENLRSNVFMIESGWNALKDMIIDTRFCKYMHNYAQGAIAEAFATMARCYMYECVSMKTDKCTSINITLANDSAFEVIVCKDTSYDFKRYVGKWQDWDFDENGKFLSSHAKHEDIESPSEDEEEVNNDDD